MKTANVLGLALTVALAACSGQQAPEAASATAAQPAAAPAPASAPVDAAAATAATPAAAEPGAAPAADGRSLCAAGERIVFACRTGGGQSMLSLCASQGASDASGRVYFAEGAGGKPAYVFPADQSAPAGRFKRTHLSFGGSTGGFAYSFEDGGRKRIVYSISGDEGLEDQGLIVAVPGAAKAESSVACDAGSVVEDEDEALFKFTLSWPKDAAIEKSGLPARN